PSRRQPCPMLPPRRHRRLPRCRRRRRADRTASRCTPPLLPQDSPLQSSTDVASFSPFRFSSWILESGVELTAALDGGGRVVDQRREQRASREWPGGNVPGLLVG